MTPEEFQQAREALSKDTEALFTEVQEHSDREADTVEVLENAPAILDEIDRDFEERTSLRGKDICLLFLGTALQVLRIYLLEKFQDQYPDEDRYDHNAAEVKQMEKDGVKQFTDKHKDWKTVKSEGKKYRTWQEIAFTIKVPYDSTSGCGQFLGPQGSMHGGLHRVKTLGHDPVLGWVFGTANIMTDTITICPEKKLGEKKLPLPSVQSYTVDLKKFKWTGRTTTTEVFKGMVESSKEDIHRLYAAIFIQGLHLESDKYTKNGLPVPFLSLLNSDKAYELYQSGYDYLDFEYDTQILRRTAKSAVLSLLINAAVSAIHNFFYNPEKDGDRRLYAVRTRKVVLYSNLIATSSDLIKTAVNLYMGDVKSARNFDLGGFLITLKRLLTDVEFIEEVKREFISNEWDRMVRGIDE